MNRWEEYDAGKLSPGDTVQQDECGDEMLYWVITTAGIIGPMSRRGKDGSAEVVKAAFAIAATPPPKPEPDYRAEYTALSASIKAIDTKLAKADIVAALAKLQTAAVDVARAEEVQG